MYDVILYTKKAMSQYFTPFNFIEKAAMGPDKNVVWFIRGQSFLNQLLQFNKDMSTFSLQTIIVIDSPDWNLNCAKSSRGLNHQSIWKSVVNYRFYRATK